MHRSTIMRAIAGTLLSATLACATLTPVVPELTWDHAADHEVIAYDCFAGLVPMEIQQNHIPTFRLWGDGRAIWVHEWAGGERRVLTATFTDAEVTALLTQMAQRHFFTLADSYEPDYEIMDGGVCQLRVVLSNTTKSVSVLTGANPPDDYWDLTGLLVSGGDHAASDYVPERGYVLATPLQDPVSAADASWPAEGLGGVQLANAAGGVAAEGEALAKAWSIVNANPYAVVESGGATYRLVVQVEGVTRSWPGQP